MRRSVLAAVLVLAVALVAIQLAGARPLSSSAAATSQVVVPRGQPVQIAFTADTTQLPIVTDFSTSAENAIRMAVERRPTVRGFPVQVNRLETLCLAGD